VSEEQEVKLESEKQIRDGEQAEELKAEPETETILEQEGEVAVEGEEVDPLEAVRKELEEARAKENEYLDGWQRARAELANARKRFQRDQQQAYTNAKADVLIRLLPIIDDFERALETLPKDLSSHGWVEGIKLIQCKAQALLQQEGVTHIDAVGEEFDPFRHQAVTHEPSDEVPEGHVIAEMQRGYSLGDRVLRPCMVRVSAGPRPEPDEEPISEEQEPDAEGEPAITEES
jgi:molecular chaperone GrpE